MAVWRTSVIVAIFDTNLVVFIEVILIHLFENFTFSLLGLKAQPFFNFLRLFAEVRVDMIETLIPSGISLALQANNVFAETTPELTLAIAPDPSLFGLLRHVVFNHPMLIFEMLLEHLLSVEELGAADLIWPKKLATPSFQLKMLRILVPFPVVFGAEILLALWKGASVRSSVSFHVFSARKIRQSCLCTTRPTYFKSHLRGTDFLHILHIS